MRIERLDIALYLTDADRDQFIAEIEPLIKADSGNSLRALRWLHFFLKEDANEQGI
jgi:hypothetical protein